MLDDWLQEKEAMKEQQELLKFSVHKLGYSDHYFLEQKLNH